MTRRRFARPCSFSRRKTARRYGFQGLLNLHSLALRFQGFAALEVAVRHRDWHAERFGYANIEFLHGHIENLATVGIADDCMDAGGRAMQGAIADNSKTAITGINELLKSEFGYNAIQAAAGQDNTPTGTAGRILSLSTSLFEAFKQNHTDENANDVLTKFMDTIRIGFENGAKEAQGILKGMGVLNDD